MKKPLWLKSNILLLPWQRFAASLLVGFVVGFFSYILFLQTPNFSRRYLLLGIVIAITASVVAYFLLKRHPFARDNDYFISRRGFLFMFLLSFLALPSYVFAPPYPKLPFFQRESTLVINVKTGSEPVSWSQLRKIYLNSGVDRLGFRAFQISESWIPSGDDFILRPDSVGQIIWHGRVGQHAAFALPIPSPQLTITTTWDHEVRQTPIDRSPYIQNKNFIAPLWYIGLVYLVAGIALFFLFITMDGFPWVRRFVLFALILGFGFIQTNLQFQMLENEFHRPLQEAIETVQLPRHADVLNGNAPNPWQYRVLSEWVVEFFLYFFSSLFKLDHAVFRALWSLRVLQNFILLTLAYIYFRKVGITKTVSVYGVFLLVGGMLHVFHESDLSFNTYFDVIFYLLAGILILGEKYEWIPVLMIVAALNRETSAMIPVLLILWGWFGKSNQPKKALISGLIGLFVWGLIFVALHLYYPNAPIFDKVTGGISPGWRLFRYNLTVPKMPILLFQTLGFLPLAGLLVHKHWNVFVRLGFLILVPVWIAAHALTSVWAETRLFLVLLSLVFIPAVLPWVDQVLKEIRQSNQSLLPASTPNLLRSQNKEMC